MSEDKAEYITGPPPIRKVVVVGAPQGSFSKMRRVALFLFDLLDNIDTADDVAKGNDAAYRRIVQGLQRRRFEVARTDGYEVEFLDVERCDGDGRE